MKIRIFTLAVLLLFVIIGYSQPVCTRCVSNTSLDTGLVACYPFNGNANDESGNGFNGSVYGAVLTSDRFANPSSAYSFNGSTQYIRLGDILDSVFARIPVAQFSVSGWAKTNTLTMFAGGGIMVGKMSGAGANGYQWSVNHDNDGRVRAMVANVSANNLIELQSATVIPTGQWFHFAITFDGSLPKAQRFRLYVDTVAGSIYKDIGSIGTTTTNTNQEVTIGSGHTFNNPASPNNQYNGTVDDIKIYSRVLSYSEITQTYREQDLRINVGQDRTIILGDSIHLSATGSTTGVTYSWSPSTGLSNPSIWNPKAFPSATTEYVLTVSNGSCVSRDTVLITVLDPVCATCTSADAINSGLLFCVPMNGNANDVTSNPLTVSSNTATLTSDRFGSAQSAYDFTAHRIRYNSDVKTSIPIEKSFSIGAWIYVRSIKTDPNAVVHITGSDGSSVALYMPGLQSPGVAGKLRFLDYHAPTSTIKVGLYSPNPVVLNQWNYIAATVDKGTGKNILYLNGVIVDSITGTNSVITNGALSIGNHYTVNWDYNGVVDDVRMYNRALSPVEIFQLYRMRNSIVTNAGTDATIAQGDTIQLSATGSTGVAYSWSPSAGLSNPSIANPKAFPSATTEYVLTVSNGSCVSRDTVLITVLDPVCATCTSADAINSGLFFCVPMNGNANDVTSNPLTVSSNTATLTSDRFGSAQSAYDFTAHRIRYNSDVKTSIPIEKSFSIGAWIYVRSIKTDPNAVVHITGSDESSVALYMPGLQSPGVAGKLRFLDYHAPTSTIKVGLYSPNPVVLNQWNYIAATVDKGTGKNILYLNGVIVDSITGTNSVITNGALSIGNHYTVNWDYNGLIDDVRMYNRALSPVEIFQLYRLRNPIIANAGADTTICRGDSVRLTAAGGSKYKWDAQPSLSNDTISTPYASPLVTTNYSVTVTEGMCIAKDTVRVTVNTVVADAGSDVVICRGDSAQLSATGGTAYVWNNTTSLSNGSVSNPYASPLSTTDYIVTVAGGVCSSQDTVRVTVQTPNIANAGSDVAICGGDSVQLFATGGTTYSWNNTLSLSNDTVSNPYASPLSTTDYIVTATEGVCSSKDTVRVTVQAPVVADAGSDVAICGGDSIQLFATGGTTYSWNNASSLSSDTVSAPYALPLSTTDYIVTVTGGICSSQDTVRVIVQTPIVADAGSDVVICGRDSVQLSATGGSNYFWFPSATLTSDTISAPYAFPLSTTDYIVTVTDGACSSKDTVRVTVQTPIIADAGADVSICAGDSIQLSATGGVLYVWNASASLSSSTVYNPYASPLSTTKYVVTVTEGVCTSKDSVTVTVNQLPEIFAGADLSVCKHRRIVIPAVAARADQYQWFPGETLDNASVLQPNAGPLETTQYVIKALNSLTGCANYDTVVVTVNHPTASFTADPLEGTAPLDVKFTNSSVPSGAIYTWHVDDIDTVYREKNPEHRFTRGGTFSVKLLVTDANGCSDTASVLINVLQPTGLVKVSSSAMNIKVFPNPSGMGVFMFTTAGNIDLKNAAVTLLNQLGQEINTQYYKMSENSLDISTLKSGLYYVRITFPSGEHAVVRLAYW